MAKIDALITKAKQIAEHERTRFKKQFEETYKNLEKTISFNQNWLKREVGALGRIPHNVVFDPEWRLILEHGDMVKFVDNQYGMKFIAIGTHFGTVVLSQIGYGGDVAYQVTPAFAMVWNDGYETTISSKGDFNVNAPHFLHESFFSHVDELAELVRAEGGTITDGMPKPIPKKKFVPKTSKPQRKHSPHGKAHAKAKDMLARQ